MTTASPLLVFPTSSEITHLREDIEHMIPDIKPVLMNCCLCLVFDDLISKAVVDRSDNSSTEVSIFPKAAKILWQGYLSMKQAFTGSVST
jgi:hypothetical protein